MFDHVVFVNDHNIVSVFVLRQRRLRNDNRVFLGAGTDHDVDIAAGDQHVVLVFEFGINRHSGGTGVDRVVVETGKNRLFDDLAVGEDDFAVYFAAAFVIVLS